MSELLFEADERTLENLMEGPWVTIEARPQSTGAKRMALFNKAGFARYAHLVDDYGCDGFAVEIEDIAENRLQAYFAPDLDRIANKDGIVEIGLTGSGAFAYDFDLDGFKRFANVRRITTGHVSFGERLPDLFPGLETWQNLDWKTDPVNGLAGRWQGLANLSLQGVQRIAGGVRRLARHRKPFLIAATIKDIVDILRFEDLDVLQIVSCRIAGDVSALSRLKKLRSFRFEGKNKLEGWERIGSDGIVNSRLRPIPAGFPGKNLRNLRITRSAIVPAIRSPKKAASRRSCPGVLGDLTRQGHHDEQGRFRTGNGRDLRRIPVPADPLRRGFRP